MYVQVGNDHAVEGYRDPNGDDPEQVLYRPLEGERVTTITFPEGMSLQEAFSATVEALSHHMSEGASPAWVDSDSDGLAALLSEHYGLSKSKRRRPKGWGKDTGADLVGVPGERS